MKKPNVLFILTDDQGYGDLACHGNPWLKTPNIDSFFEESCHLDNFHVGPTCAPTRSGLMTGHYANSTGVWHTIGGRSLLRSDEWTLSTSLHDAGYKTGIFGKWHLGDSAPYRPEDRGFDKVVVHGGGGISQTPDYWGNDYFDDTYREDGEYKKFNGYCTDVFTGEAKKFISESVNQDKPFFCYLAFNAPHSPYNVADKYADQYRGKVEENRARFYGMITNIDENIGKIRKFIEDLNIEKNTIVIFMTDNGSSKALTYDKDGNIKEGYNAGLRGLKDSEYDGGHRVPFFIRYPELSIEGNKTIHTLCANVDFMPTILDLCDINVKGHTFHGVSLKKELLGKKSELDDRFIVTDSQRVPNPIKWRKSCVMKGDYRLINGRELYDLADDLAQEHNIADQNPELVKTFCEAYEKWWKLVSVKFSDAIPLYMRKKNILTSHDWRGDADNCVWNQGLIRAAKKTRGGWEILVEETGLYSLKFFRWPVETGYVIGQGITGNDTGYKKSVTQKEYWNYYEGGESVAPKRVLVFLDSKEKPVASASVDLNKSYVETKIELIKGQHFLEGCFEEKDSNLFGCYYMEIDGIN